MFFRPCSKRRRSRYFLMCMGKRSGFTCVCVLFFDVQRIYYTQMHDFSFPACVVVISSLPWRSCLRNKFENTTATPTSHTFPPLRLHLVSKGLSCCGIHEPPRCSSQTPNFPIVASSSFPLSFRTTTNGVVKNGNFNKFQVSRRRAGNEKRCNIGGAGFTEYQLHSLICLTYYFLLLCDVFGLM